MRYRLVAVGGIKRKFYRQACQFYLERLMRFSKSEVLEVKESRHSDPAQRQHDESQGLLAAAEGYVVALDERGDLQGSSALAEQVSRLENQGHSRISLLLGGAEGHAESLRQSVQACWSLSPLTLPHELARLVLLEQLYRCETIRAGHPYHRDS